MFEHQSKGFCYRVSQTFKPFPQYPVQSLTDGATRRLGARQTYIWREGLLDIRESKIFI